MASSDDLIQAIRDSEIAFNVPDADGASGSLRTWLFDDAAGDLVVPQPAPFTIVLDGDDGTVVTLGDGEARTVLPSGQAQDAVAGDSLGVSLPSWLAALRGLPRAARTWFDT